MPPGASPNGDRRGYHQPAAVHSSERISTLRIGIFTNVLAHKPSGIGWHVIHLLEALARIDQGNEYFLFYRKRPGDSDDSFFCPQAENFRNVPVPAADVLYQRFFRVFDRFLLPRAIVRHRIDVFHGPNHYLPARRKAAQVVTYHDLAEAKFQLGGPDQQAAAQQAVRRTLDRADHVITVSQCTKRDVVEFNFDESRVSAICQGANLDGLDPVGPQLVEQTKRQFAIDGRYVLFVGSIVPRKNLGLLLRAYAQLRSRMPDCPLLVLAGGNDTDEFARLKTLADTLGICAALRWTGYLGDEQFRGLYAGASLFVLPSLYEGFGMPVLEAMAHGVPVIATRAGALEQVVADAGVLVDPDDDNALARAMESLLNDAAAASDLVARGRSRCVGPQFSWRNCAEQTLAVYERLARSGA